MMKRSGCSIWLAAALMAALSFACSSTPKTPPPGDGLPPASCASDIAISPGANTVSTDYNVERLGRFNSQTLWVFQAEAGYVVAATLTANGTATRGSLALLGPSEPNQSTPPTALATGVDVEEGGRTVTRLTYEVVVTGVYTLIALPCAAVQNDVYRIKLVCAGGTCVGRNCPQVCLTGENRCAGDVIELCSLEPSTGCLQWDAGADCAALQGGHCVNTICETPCRDECLRGVRRCTGDTPQVCENNSRGCTQWNSLTTCTSSFACKGGQCIPRTQIDCDFPNVMVVLDKSGSMSEMIAGADGGSKMDVAKEAIRSVVQAKESKFSFGLMTFPGGGGWCGDGLVLSDPSLSNYTPLWTILATVGPGGATPIAGAVRLAGTQPSLIYSPWRSFLLLLTDGAETCADDPVQMPIAEVVKLADAGIPTFVVGFGDGVDVYTLNKMAVASGTARAGCNGGDAGSCYYQADDPLSLVAALDAISGVISQEVCDGRDNNCNGEVDENLTRTCASDCGTGVERCVWGKWLYCTATVRNDAGECPTATDEDAGAGPDAGL